MSILFFLLLLGVHSEEIRQTHESKWEAWKTVTITFFIKLKNWK